jgi:hypothetical protein
LYNTRENNMSDMTAAVDPRTPLPPHGPANMLSLYMTRYDYDYNREGKQLGGTGKGEGESSFGPGISGDVRNRPIFAYSIVENGSRDARTVYQVDYTGKDRGVKDMQRLAASVRGGPAAAAGTAAVDGGDNGTAYQREWYRPGLTASLLNEDGTLPQTAYQEDYRQPSAVLVPQPGPSSNEPRPQYAGSAAAAYNADLLKPHGVQEDDGADIAPKITSKESLLPRGQRGVKPPGWAATLNTTDNNGSGVAPVTRSAGPSSTLGPAAALPGMYSCTSWDIGDVSQAHPSQLPVSLARSIAANGVDVTANPDKAVLLRQLAGKKSAAANGGHAWRSGKGGLRDEYDRTNPQLLSAYAQKTCAVSRRLEEERHVHMSMYKSDYVDQSQLPELPGNPFGPADVRDTQTCPTAAAGEMTAGQLTAATREMGLLRNSHGTLKAAAAAGGGGESAALSSMRATEKAIAIDKADPHRHKLR